MLRSIGPILALVLAAACAGDPEGPTDPDLRVRVSWLTGGPTATIPPDVSLIRILLITNGGASIVDTNVSVGSFMMRDDGGLYVANDLLNDLPTGEPILVRVEGQRTDGSFAYLGHVGPVVLAAGQRYYADVTMYELDESSQTPVDGTPSVMLHAATALPDGRVLVTGGFDSLEPGDCPAGQPADTRCFAATATRDAWVFEPTSGRFFPIQGGMRQPRAGHSATVLPGGRVLVAGGAPRATLALVPLVGDGTFVPLVLPLDDAGEPGAHASFEIFLPSANAETDDIDGNLDPGRGGFVGSASDPDRPGALNDGRFMHGAAPLPATGTPERVLLVGGLGDGDEAETYELYDDDKPGGYGVYDASGARMAARHALPGVAQLASGDVWIVGGGEVATSNGALAEIWTADATNPTGTTEPASVASEFGADGAHPEWALARPDVVAIDGARYAIVVGWLGPRCMGGEPVFPASPDGAGTDVCGSTGGAPRGFTIDGETGAALGTATAAPHALGGSALLDDGSVVVTGGFANLSLTRQAAIEIFTGEVSGGTATLSPIRYMLRSQRALHTTTALPYAGVLSVGGLNLSADAREATLVQTAEALYLRRSPTMTTP